MLLFIWLNIHWCGHVGGSWVGELCGELCGGSWGELCGVGELCKGNCVGSYVGQWVGLRGGAVWVGGWCCARELCVGASTPVTRWSGHTHTIASSTPSTRGIPHYPLTHPAPPFCPCPQQQPGSPLQSVPTSPTACSSACAPSGSLSR